MNLKGRDFLTLKDYTPEEIEYLIELAAKLKKMKKDGVVEQPKRNVFPPSHYLERMLLLYLKRQVQEHVVHLKLQHTTLVWA